MIHNHCTANELCLIEPTAEYIDRIAEYRSEFPADRMRVTYDPARIPGMDFLEKFGSIGDWPDSANRKREKSHGT